MPDESAHPPDAPASMRTVVLAGGFGSRLQEETDTRPKPMVEIGGRPILWHIMKLYGSFGLSHFVVALGYKGDQIKSYFLDYRNISSNLRVDTRHGTARLLDAGSGSGEDWTIDLVDTGYATNTGGRVRRLAAYLPGDSFCVTYGDGVTNADISKIVSFHEKHGRLVTLMAVRPPARFGWLELDGEEVVSFVEKPALGEGWVNGGFMVLKREVLDLITSDDQSLELDVIAPLAGTGQVMAVAHSGFWQPMDTMKDVRTLRALWDSGSAPWKVWDQEPGS